MSNTGYRLPSDSFSGPLSEARAASTAGGGTSLSTTATIVGFPNGTTHVAVVARNFSTAVVTKFALNPYLLILKAASALPAAPTDYSKAAQQNPATTDSVVLDALAATAFLYIGAYVPFRGIAVTMDGAKVNANAATLSMAYWNGAWKAQTITDGTAAAGATLAQTGNVTWTVPTDWTATKLGSTVVGGPVSNPDLANFAPYSNRPKYWLRLAVSAALSVSVEANSIFALNRSTAYAEMVQDSLLQFRIPQKGGADVDGPSCIEALTDAGTASLIVNCYADNPLGAF